MPLAVIRNRNLLLRCKIKRNASNFVTKAKGKSKTKYINRVNPYINVVFKIALEENKHTFHIRFYQLW